MAGIVDMIKTNYTVDKDMIKKWQSIKGVLIRKGLYTEINVDASASEAYQFDLEGLFLNEVKIRPEFVYPHIMVNGYNSSQSYDGRRTNFYLIDNQMLSMYYNLFKRK